MVLALALALLAAGAPAVADAKDVEARNVDWILALLGLRELPEGDATLFDAGGPRVVPVADAIRAAAARAGDVDLAALAVSGAPGERPYGVGDVWLLEVNYERGTCPEPVPGLATPLPMTGLHPQLHTYFGRAGIASSEDEGVQYSLIVDWTTKMATGGSSLAGSTVAGQSDWWCFHWWNFAFWFPFVDGVVVAHGPAVA